VVNAFISSGIRTVGALEKVFECFQKSLESPVREKTADFGPRLFTAITANLDKVGAPPTLLLFLQRETGLRSIGYYIIHMFDRAHHYQPAFSVDSLPPSQLKTQESVAVALMEIFFLALRIEDMAFREPVI